MQITLDTAKAVYRNVIDSRASDGEGAAWWDEVADEGWFPDYRKPVVQQIHAMCVAHLSHDVSMI